MTDMNTRTLKAFDEEFEPLRARIAAMGGLAEVAVEQSMRALTGHDRALAASVVSADRRIDAAEEEVERDAVRLIALYAPVAADLRDVVAALKISGVIERIGDYAKNIARRAPMTEDVGVISLRPPSPLLEMARVATEMVRDALDAFVARDTGKAVLVSRRDDTVDAFYDQIFQTLLVYMAKNPPGITPAAHLLYIARSLERIADHATNIAGMVHYAATGRRVEEREESDMSGTDL